MRFETFGKKLSRIRKNLGIKQEYFTRIGVSRSYISKIESKEKNPPFETMMEIYHELQRWSEIEGVTLDISFDELRKSPEEQAREYVNNLLKEEHNEEELIELIDICDYYNLIDLLPAACFKYSMLLYDKQDYVATLRYLYRKLELEIKENKETFRTYRWIGNSLTNLPQYDTAIVNYKLAISELDHECKEKYEILVNLAYVYRYAKDYKSERELTSRILNEVKPYKELYARVILLMSSFDEGDPDLRDNTSLLLEIINNEDYGNIREYALNNLGNYYYLIGDYQKAIYYLEQTIYIRKNHNEVGYYRTLFSLCKAKYYAGLIEEAIGMLSEVQTMLMMIDSQIYERNFYRFKAVIALDRGLYETLKSTVAEFRKHIDIRKLKPTFIDSFKNELYQKILVDKRMTEDKKVTLISDIARA